MELSFFPGQSRLEVLVRKPVETEQTFTWRRIVYKLDLNSIYPEKPVLVQFNVSVSRSIASPTFKGPYSFLLDHNQFYFLTSVDQPATLRVNVYLNSTLKPVQDLRKYTRVFNVRPEKDQKTHVFELKASGSLENVLKSEKAILQQFESKLWKSAKPCRDCLSIAYISPDVNQYRIGIANTQRHSDLLDEFCFLGNIPSEQLKIADLNINLNKADCQRIAAVKQHRREEYLVNAFVNVGVKPMDTERSFGFNRI